MGYLISLLLYNFLSPPPFIRENKKEQGEYFWAFFASYFDTTETQIKDIFKKKNLSVTSKTRRNTSSLVVICRIAGSMKE